jgi:hypothetical protein
MWMFFFLLFLIATTDVQGAIHGQIISGELDAALPGVTVCIQGSSVCKPTDDRGNFDFDATAGQVVTLTATLAGYGQEEYTVRACKAKSRRIQLLLNQTSMIIDCTTGGPTDASRYAIRGRVASDRGPVSRARLTLLTLEHTAIRSGTSDRSGRFEVKSFPEGTYILQVAKSGYDDQFVKFRVQYCEPQKELTVPLSAKCEM